VFRDGYGVFRAGYRVFRGVNECLEVVFMKCFEAFIECYQF